MVGRVLCFAIRLQCATKTVSEICLNYDLRPASTRTTIVVGLEHPMYPGLHYPLTATAARLVVGWSGGEGERWVGRAKGGGWSVGVGRWDVGGGNGMWVIKACVVLRV